MRLAAGTHCIPCDRRGHVCYAYTELEIDEDGTKEAMCLDCANDKACLFDRVGSGPKQDPNEDVFTVPKPAAPPHIAKPEPLPAETSVLMCQGRYTNGDSCRHRAAKGLSFCAHDHYEAMVRERKLSNKPRVIINHTKHREPATERLDLEKAVLAEPHNASAKELALKYNVSVGTIYHIRMEARMQKADDKKEAQRIEEVVSGAIAGVANMSQGKPFVPEQEQELTDVDREKLNSLVKRYKRSPWSKEGQEEVVDLPPSHAPKVEDVVVQSVVRYGHNPWPEDTDPLLIGLIEQLPELGTVWKTADRVRWMNLASAIFDVLYGCESAIKK